MAPSIQLRALFANAMSKLTFVKNVLLVSPEMPDPDSIFSILAFREFLRRQRTICGEKISCTLYCPDALPHNALYEIAQPLCGSLEIFMHAHPDPIPDLCVLFDYGDFARAHIDTTRTKDDTFFLGFDHHPRVPGFPANGLEIIDEKAPSTTALLWKFFRYAKFCPNPDVATILLAGLAADTGKFSNSLANTESFEITGQMMRRGARYAEILDLMQPHITHAAFIARGMAANRLWFDKDDPAGFAFLWFSQKDLREWHVDEKDILPLMGQIQNIEGMRVAAIYHELESGIWHCSIRTNPDCTIMAVDIATPLGGGGHAHAAAFDSREWPSTACAQIRHILDNGHIRLR